MNIAKELYGLYQGFNVLDNYVYNKLRDNDLTGDVCYHIIIANSSIYFHTFFENVQELDEGIMINYVDKYHISDDVVFHFSEELVNHHSDIVKKIKQIFTIQKENK